MYVRLNAFDVAYHLQESFSAVTAMLTTMLMLLSLVQSMNVINGKLDTGHEADYADWPKLFSNVAGVE